MMTKKVVDIFSGRTYIDFVVESIEFEFGKAVAHMSPSEGIMTSVSSRRGHTFSKTERAEVFDLLPSALSQTKTTITFLPYTNPPKTRCGSGNPRLLQ